MSDDDALQALNHAEQLKQEELEAMDTATEQQRHLVEYLCDMHGREATRLREMEQEMLRADPGYQEWLDELERERTNG